MKEAANGLDALARVYTEAPPDLLLLDVRLPGLDGFEVCRLVKADPCTLRLPVLQISAACVTDADWACGLEAGADNYLIEPVAAEVLIGTIRQLLLRRGREEALHAAQLASVDKLRASEQRYRTLFLHAPHGIYTVTMDGEVRTANRALAQIVGVDTPEALLALNASAFFASPADRDAVLAAWQRHDRVETHETNWLRQDGTPLRVRLTGRRLDEHPSPLFEVFVEDVTEQRRLEAEARQVHKMKAIGQLAAGVAHDFNNLLTAILGYTELMLEQIDADKPIHGDLREVQKAGRSAARLTQQLLAFSRKQTVRIEVLDLHALIAAHREILQRLIGETIRVVVSAGEAPGRIHADPVQLEQVLVNLAVNARDAMPDGGTLTIHTTAVTLSHAPFPAAVRVTPGAYVCVTVTDTGCGMDADTLTHLFEPFFTTKATGQGTGLGLATVYGIVKQLGGYIWVDSAPGQGTTFTLYFPATEATCTDHPDVEQREPMAMGRERILIVEDEPGVRTLAASVLSRHGYRVLEAESPAAALDIVAASADPIDLVLTDMVMPGMSGPELVRRLQQYGPLRAVYMSGYAEDVATGRLFDTDVVFVAKPFSQAELMDAVRLMLDRGQPETRPHLSVVSAPKRARHVRR